MSTISWQQGNADFDGNSIAVKGDGVAAIATQQATTTSSIKSETII